VGSANRQPGWDKQAINRIANDEYGGLQAMFEAHGWATDGRVISQIAPTKIVGTYGSVEAFERAHEHGVASNAMLDPKAAILSDPPDVWLTSLYGFTPGSWGFLGWSDERMRTSFLKQSRPGALVVVYAAGGAEPELRRRVLGVQQVTHRTGSKWDFLAPDRVDAERSDADRRDKWVHAIKLTRGWRIPPECRPLIDDFAPETYNAQNARAIGARCMRLTPNEARSILDLTLIECPVFDGEPVDIQLPGPASKALCPSRPGPVAQGAYMVREAEGPKHLYILRLKGETDSFLGYGAAGKSIIKVGFSVSPQARCDAHNKALPACAFEWQVHRSTFDQGRAPFPSSGHALAGENVMKAMLHEQEQSLGGEFFLAHQDSIDRAWKGAIAAAENWKA
jgi:hypothetical protein